MASPPHSPPVTSGVPQGSILGPLLFIIFMNSITNLKLLTGAKLVLFPDDILLYKTVDSPLASQHEQDVDKIFSWISHHMTSHQTHQKLTFYKLLDLKTFQRFISL